MIVFVRADASYDNTLNTNSYIGKYYGIMSSEYMLA